MDCSNLWDFYLEHENQYQAWKSEKKLNFYRGVKMESEWLVQKSIPNV